MSRPVRLTLTLMVAALAGAALATSAYAQDAIYTEDPAVEEQTAPPAEDGSLTPGDEAAEAEEADEELEMLEEDSNSAADEREPQQQTAGEDESDTAQADDEERSCDDFSSQAEAQEYFTDQGGDATHNVDNLDADGDGQACESLNAPTGGVQAGTGPISAPAEDASRGPLPYLFGGAALGLALGGLSLLGRRRRASAS